MDEEDEMVSMLSRMLEKTDPHDDDDVTKSCALSQRD